ncbi:MAG: TraB/GumN family protein [Oscillospiraceae bacterium]|nr:TraB/GumN family protein [Oscillospiraceae bacterium]
MKKLTALILVLTVLLGLTGCPAKDAPAGTEATTIAPDTTIPTADSEPTDATEPEEEPSSPILYKVTDDQGRILYLFGAIHIGTEEMYPLPSYVQDAYDQSDILAVECEGADTPQEMEQEKQCALLGDGVTIQDLLSPETYRAAKKILEETGVYQPEFEDCKPIVWQSIIDGLAVQKSGADSALGVDLQMMEKARGDGKPIEEIEPVAEHYRYMGDLSMELQCLLLEDTVASYRNPMAIRANTYLCRLWAQGNESFLRTILSVNLDQIPDERERALYQEYQDVIQTQRDANMTQYAMEAMASGQTVFICVGLAHIIGEGAMVDRLTQAGYTLERVEG